MNVPLNTPLRIERLFGGQPIIQRNPLHLWENRITFNAACALVSNRDELTALVGKLPFDYDMRNALLEQPALCVLLYRAQGDATQDYDYMRASVGLAVTDAELNLLARHHEPVIIPNNDYDALGIGDGRVTKVGRRHIIVYTAHSIGDPKNKARLAMASTVDFATWIKHGLVHGQFNTVDTTDGMIFERKVGKSYVMTHRPMEGELAKSLHWAESIDVYHDWRTRGVLIKPRSDPQFAETWVGGGAPPLKLPDGRYLILYNIGHRRADGSTEHHLGIAIGDPGARGFIVKRLEPIMQPETPVETTGDEQLGKNDSVFVCGAYLWNGDLYFPYSGAGSVVLGARIPKSELDQFLSR